MTPSPWCVSRTSECCETVGGHRGYARRSLEGSGEGTIHTYAVQHLVPPAFQSIAPYVTAYIDLKEADRMLTILRGVDPNKPEDIRIGAKVRVEFEDMGEDMHIPFWRVVED